MIDAWRGPSDGPPVIFPIWGRPAAASATEDNTISVRHTFCTCHPERDVITSDVTIRTSKVMTSHDSDVGVLIANQTVYALIWFGPLRGSVVHLNAVITYARPMLQRPVVKTLDVINK